MKKQVRKQQTEETFIDKLKGIGLVGIPLWILLFVLGCIGFSECQDKHSKKSPTPPPYRLEEVNKPRMEMSPATKHSVKSVRGKDDALDSQDYYDIYEYHDGLDGEYSDIDYNDITDYHAD